MNYFLCFLLLVLPLVSLNAQNLDPLWEIWKYEHGATIEEFVNEKGEINYYVTWSSSAGTPWGHDIYNQIIEFDTGGRLGVVSDGRKFISTWEAQEPISTAINSTKNIIFSIWEDGTDSNIKDEAVNVHGQLHYPDGSIIKENWIIAGGPEAQHSAVGGHLNNKFLAVYVDDYNSSGGGAVKAITIDDNSGKIMDTLHLTPPEEYNWWPVIASNNRQTRALTVYSKDVEMIAGTILFTREGKVEYTASKTYLTGIRFVNQQINWLENISRFVVIAKTLNSNKSKICIIDTLGNKSFSTEVYGAIVQEAKPAVKWNNNTQSYYYVYPTGVNDLIVLAITDSSIAVSNIIEGNGKAALSSIKWEATGIWSTFAKDVNGNDTWGDKNIALFVMGNYFTNESTLIPVSISSSDFVTGNNAIGYRACINVFPNPVKGNHDITISIPAGKSKVFTLSIIDMQGRVILNERRAMSKYTKINMQGRSGIYFIEIKMESKIFTSKVVVNKL